MHLDVLAMLAAIMKRHNIDNTESYLASILCVAWRPCGHNWHATNTTHNHQFKGHHADPLPKLVSEGFKQSEKAPRKIQTIYHKTPPNSLLENSSGHWELSVKGRTICQCPVQKSKNYWKDLIYSITKSLDARIHYVRRK